MTMTLPSTRIFPGTPERRVWVGCLACYNDGRLMGDWYDADAVGELTSEELYEAHDPRRHDVKDRREGYGAHEEIWCFDIEGFGHWNREMSPSEAYELDRAITALTDATGADPEAVFAWASNIGADKADLEGGGFEDEYHGEHDSAEAFVQNMADEIYGDRDGALGPYGNYIDWERVARDYGFDGWHFHETDHGTVYVFGP